MLAPPRAAILDRSYSSHSLGSLVDGKEKLQLSAAPSLPKTATSKHKRPRIDRIFVAALRAKARDIFTSNDVMDKTINNTEDYGNKERFTTGGRKHVVCTNCPRGVLGSWRLASLLTLGDTFSILW